MNNSNKDYQDWMLQDPRTKEGYDRYMQFRINLGDGFFPVYDYGFEKDLTPLIVEPAGENRFRWVSGGYKQYYQLKKDSEKIYLTVDQLKTINFWVPIDPRWEHTQNRTPYSYKDEYRGQPETWAPVPWDSFENERCD